MAAGIVVALVGTALTPVTADAAPGETWSGTLQVIEERSGTTTDAFGSPTGTFSKVHVTSFAVQSSSGEDDDPHTQPLAGWETSVDHRWDSDGDCYDYLFDYYQGEVMGAGGVLELTPDTATDQPRVRIHIAGHGPNDSFPVTRRYHGCNDRSETTTTASYPHHGFTVLAPGDLETSTELVGNQVEQRSDGSTTYEWDLTRRTEPPPAPTDEDDDLQGTDGDDFIELQAGNDSYSGGAGNDVAYGGSGDDALAGEGGADQLIGGHGADTLRGGAGNDLIKGDGPNSAPVVEAVADNRMRMLETTGPGPDLLFGGRGRDRLIGGAGLDRFNAGSGRDVCIVNSRKEKRRAKGCETIKLRHSR